MTAQLKVGDAVKVLSLKRKGIVISIANNGTLKVSVGDLEMRCKPGDLEFVESHQDAPAVNRIKFQKSKIKVPTTLDLHGLNSKLAEEALLQFLSDAVMANHKQISIVHGHGDGVLKRLVHSLLSSSQVVASFRHPINDAAVTKAYLR